tara:strand:- start:1286 stop:1846 length:561 start_codon:yes stop_codon:yes gene_type:complete
MDKEKKAPEADTSQLCRLFNLTSARIGQLAKDGVIFKTGRNRHDLWKSVRGYIEFLQRSKAGSGVDDKINKAKCDSKVTLQTLLEQVKVSTTYNDTRTLKMQIDALKSGFALEVEQGTYTTKDSQHAEGMRMGLVIKGVMLRMESDLTPRLAGRKSTEVSKILAEYSRSKLTELSLYESSIIIPTD